MQGHINAAFGPTREHLEEIGATPEEIEAERIAFVCGAVAVLSLINDAVEQRPARVLAVLRELNAEAADEQRKLLRAVAEMN